MSSYKPELQVSARNLEEVKRLAQAGADAIFVGNQQFANRQPGDFSLFEIKEATEWLHSQGKNLCNG